MFICAVFVPYGLPTNGRISVFEAFFVDEVGKGSTAGPKTDDSHAQTTQFGETHVVIGRVRST
jgi:hypothetical protein